MFSAHVLHDRCGHVDWHGHTLNTYGPASWQLLAGRQLSTSFELAVVGLHAVPTIKVPWHVIAGQLLSI